MKIPGARDHGRISLLKHILVIVASVCLVLGIFIVVFDYYINTLFEEVEKQYRQNLINIISVARNALEPTLARVRSGEISREEAIRLIRPMIRSMIYEDGNGKNYIFFTSYDGTTLVQPLSPQREMTNDWDLQDSKGLYIVRELVKAAKARPAGSFVRYYSYQPPNYRDFQEKLTYVAGFPEIECCIGTGMYMERVVVGQKGMLMKIKYASIWLIVMVLVPVSISIFVIIKKNKQLAAEIGIREGAEEDLKKSEERYRSIFENTVEGLFRVSADGHIIEANPTLARIAGFESPKEILGVVVEQYYADPSDRKLFLKILIEKGFVKDYPLLMKRKDGTSFWSSHNVKVVRDGEGNILYFEGSLEDIDARKRAEEEAGDLAEIIRHSNELVNLADLDGKMVFLNAAGSKMLGIDPEAVDKANIIDVIPDALRGFVQSKVVPELLKGGSWEGELQYLNLKTGEITDVYAMTFIIDDPRTGRHKYFANVSLDITQRKQMEEKFKNVFMMTPVLVVIGSLDGGYIIDANQGYEDVLGWKRSEATGKSFTDLNFWVEETDRDFILRELRSGRDVINREIQFRRKDGVVRTGIYSARNVWLSGQTCVIYVLRDITEHKRLQDERLKLEQQLFQSQKLDAIGQLAGGIAHDFNNILLAVSGNAQLAAMDLSSDNPLQNYLAEIMKGCDRATDLVRRILLFSRPQSQGQRIIRLEDAVKEALQLLRVTIPAMIEIKSDFHPGVPSIVADVSQVHQIVVNLATNAAQAIGRDQDNGVLTFGIDEVCAGHVSPDAPSDLPEGRYVRFSVADNGCGMERAVIERIFDPFFTTKGTGKGTGLGLSVVHGIMKSIGGAVTVRSEPGKGSVFHLYFPVIDGVEKTEKTGKAPSQGISGGGGKRVLYVDDEDALVSLIKRSLERAGYVVEGFTEPAEALDKFIAHPDNFDVIVTDLSMPAMSGFSLAAQLLEVRPGIPIFMTSGYVRQEDEEKARQTGIRSVILKPNTIDELQQELQRLFEGIP